MLEGEEEADGFPFHRKLGLVKNGQLSPLGRPGIRKTYMATKIRENR